MDGIHQRRFRNCIEEPESVTVVRMNGGNGMNASVKKEENMNANQVIKEQLTRFSDPEPGMSEQEREKYHQNILAKIESGKKLSSQELAYLRANDPRAYQKARRMEQKRQWLEQQMKKCKSKQEVREVVEDAIGHVSEKDPDRDAIIATYQDAYQEFRKTARYRRLPDTRKEAEEEEKQGKRRSQPLEEGDSEEFARTPLSEVYDALPVFDTVG